MMKILSILLSSPHPLVLLVLLFSSSSCQSFLVSQQHSSTTTSSLTYHHHRHLASHNKRSQIIISTTTTTTQQEGCCWCNSEFDVSNKKPSGNNKDQHRRRDFLLSGLSNAVLTNVLLQPSQPANAGFLDFSGISNYSQVTKLANKIRNVCLIMDELQRDLMQERWDLVEKFPVQLRSFVPIFTAYTDEAFANDDKPWNKSLRTALRYEVGRFFGALKRLEQATNRKDLDDAYTAYAYMAIHFDQYLHVGDLYTYYDPTISTETYFKNITENMLVYSDPKKDPPLVRDLVILVKGPDKGKTGIVIGILPENKGLVIKLDKFNTRQSIREIRICQKEWVAKRLGQQDPDDVFLIPRK